MRTATAAAVAVILSLPIPALAIPIAAGSEVSINGSDSFTATEITFTGAANVGGTSGSFSILPNCTACVTMIGTLTSGSSGTLYSVNDAGLTSDLSFSPPTTFAFTSGALPSLTASGAGVLTLSGFDPTPGIWEVTTQGPTGASVTFSATSVASAVPEPASLVVLGSGLLALGFLRRRRVGP